MIAASSAFMSCPDQVITQMNEEIEIAREKMNIKKVYCRELENRLKSAVDRIDVHKSNLKKVG